MIETTSEATSGATQLGVNTVTYGVENPSINSSFHITTNKLNCKNYLEWAQSVKLAIDSRGKLGYLTGEVKQPTADDPHHRA